MNHHESTVNKSWTSPELLHSAAFQSPSESPLRPACTAVAQGLRSLATHGAAGVGLGRGDAECALESQGDTIQFGSDVEGKSRVGSKYTTRPTTLRESR